MAKPTRLLLTPPQLEHSGSSPVVAQWEDKSRVLGWRELWGVGEEGAAGQAAGGLQGCGLDGWLEDAVRRDKQGAVPLRVCGSRRQ